MRIPPLELLVSAEGGAVHFERTVAADEGVEGVLGQGALAREIDVAVDPDGLAASGGCLDAQGADFEVLDDHEARPAVLVSDPAQDQGRLGLLAGGELDPVLDLGLGEELQAQRSRLLDLFPAQVAAVLAEGLEFGVRLSAAAGSLAHLASPCFEDEPILQEPLDPVKCLASISRFRRFYGSLSRRSDSPREAGRRTGSGPAVRNASIRNRASS